MSKPKKIDWLAAFETFWKAYPNKQGKGYARKCFQRIRGDQDLLDRMLAAIEDQRRYREYRRRHQQWVEEWPHPSTWLNQERWDDEPDYPREQEGMLPQVKRAMEEQDRMARDAKVRPIRGPIANEG